MADVYVTALARARLDMERLVEKRKSIDERISRLKLTISGLEAIAEPPIAPAKRLSENEGLTKTIQTVFALTRGQKLLPAEIRDKCEELGYKWKTADNALQAIHAVLKRLLEKGEIKKTGEGPGAKYEDEIPF